MNPFEFVLAIIFITGVFSLIKHRMGAPDRRVGQRGWEQPVEDQGENVRLRAEVNGLKERIKVIERITVEKENSLARQIDELRDR